MFLVDGPKKIMRTLMPKSWTQGGHIPPSRSFGSSIASFSQQVLSRSGARPVVRVTFLISGTAISIIYWLVVWNMTFIFHNIWEVILPIDELHHFSRWLLHHQPVQYFGKKRQNCGEQEMMIIEWISLGFSDGFSP
jgi:hypothetical protein